VLHGRATEFEHDAPYGLWVDAVDPHLQRLDPARLRKLGGDEFDALAVAVPAFAQSLGAPTGPTERYVVHRAMRSLLERLGTSRPVVLCLDDVHWADPASLDLLAGLARRPPERAVLLAVAYRAGQVPGALVAALGEAAQTARSQRLALAPLSPAEAAAFCGGDVTAELYEPSGGNPFYLQQLAGARPGGALAALLGPSAAVPAAAWTLIGRGGHAYSNLRAVLTISR
jgi:hypothetical protein